ncbi:hypothetical protein P5673_031519 [Acropora cervicornis]|uniref:THAP-type domain-containing protein n=1 Tax=Acropora cervicornis TaxID=6130 RepID=A0AAD9PSI8_ACRCE|nr:hypothetical protein P5673_031519 [Acropora cervicornis]
MSSALHPDIHLRVSSSDSTPFALSGSDLVGGSEDDSVMADKRAKKGAKNCCAAGGPNKVNCSNKTGTPGIAMPYFPKEESLRQKWTRFVWINRRDFVPKKSSCLCSAHFDDCCFEHKPLSLMDATGEAIELKKRLIKGPVPTRTDVVPYTSPLTDRKRRRPGRCKRCEKNSKKTRSLSKKHKRLKKKYVKLESKLKELESVQEREKEIEGELFAVEMEEEMEEEVKEDVEDELEDANCGRHEDSAPSTDDYSSQTEEECDGIDSSNTMSDQPNVTMKQRGTMVIVNQHCMICGDNSYSWKSQPMMFNGRYPAGNVLLSFSMLMAGASISKILLVFKHMGLSAYNARTFFFHQTNFLFPAVLSYWERYQAALVEKIKNIKDAVWSADGRFHSMGHSAKFGVYALFCNTILKVVHFELLQPVGGGQLAVPNLVTTHIQDSIRTVFILFN